MSTPQGPPRPSAEKFAFKVVFLGESGVGKTCLATRFEKGTFVPNSASTIGAAFSTTTLELGGALVKIQMWDTAGQERYHCLAPMYYREAAGAFVVYDVTDGPSFEKAKTWILELKKNQPSCLIMLLGNKCDCRMAENAASCVPTEQVRRYADEEKLLFQEVSAKTGDNVSNALNTLAEAVCAVKKAQVQKRMQPGVGAAAKPAGGAAFQMGEHSGEKAAQDGGGCGC